MPELPEHSFPASIVNIIRNSRTSSEIYLAKYEPNIMLQAQINDGSITKGARTLNYDNVTTGSYLYVQDGMTCYVGTTPGGMELGRVRVRSIIDGSLTVAPDSDIDYVDNAYLTVKEFFEFWPVFPRAVLNTGTLTTTLYKDYDVTLSDENTNFDPIPVIGGNFASFYDLHTGIYFSATGSYTVDGSTISKVVWQFPTGCSQFIITGSSIGRIGFPGPGMYTVKCTVYASTGKSFSTYRHIALLNRYTGNYQPIKDWQLDSLEGEWGVGWNCKIKVRERANEFKDGDLVIIFTDDRYAGIPLVTPINRQELLFVGYVHYIESEYDYADSESMVFLKGISSYMQNKEMFSVQMTDTQGTPATWSEIKNLDMNKAIAHYFRWHTTLYKMTDVRPIVTAHGSYDENEIQITKGEIFTNINSFLTQRVFGKFTSDAVGRCFAEVDLNMIVTGSRPATTLELIDGDWLGKPTIIERIEQPISNVLLGGETYVAGSTTETGTAYLSRAPGELQTYTGKSENVSGVALPANGQDEINRLSGLYYAKENSRYQELALDLAINLRAFDVTPQIYYGFTIGTDDLHRKLNFNSRLIPRKISRTYDDFTLKTNIYFEFETYGPPGDTVIIPVTPPDGDTDCEENPDNCDPPCTNGCEEDPPTTGEPQGGTVYAATETKIARTRNFLESSPNWEDITGAIEGSTIYDFNLNPFDPANSAMVCTGDSIWRTNNLDSSPPTWTVVASAATFSLTNFRRIVFSIADAGRAYALGNDNVSDTWHRYVLKTIDGGDSWTLSADAGVENQAPNDGQYAIGVGQHNADVVYVSVATNAIRKSTNGGASWSTIYGAVSNFNSCVDIECPYADNENDAKVMFWANRDANDLIFFDGTGTEMTPEDSVSANGKDIPYRILTTTNDALSLYVFRLVGAFTYALDRSTDGGQTWTQNIQAGVFFARSLGGWPYDNNRIEFFSYDDFQEKLLIYSSTDGGSNLDSKLGDWETEIGDITSKGIRLIPLWTE
jgi:hypothetical protein